MNVMTRCEVRMKLIVAVALAMVSSAGYSIAEEATSATQVAVSSTKVYSNSKQRFSFDYPSAWVVIEDAPADGALFSMRLLTPDENVPVMRERSPGSFALAVFANPQRLAVHEWLDAQGWPFGTERTTRETSVAGKPALDVSTGRMFAPNRFIYLADGNRIVRLSPLAEQSQIIMSSFRLRP
jgi:PsbP-like protein